MKLISKALFILILVVFMQGCSGLDTTDHTNTGDTGLTSGSGTSLPEFPAGGYSGPFSAVRRISATDIAVPANSFVLEGGNANYVIDGTDEYVISTDAASKIAWVMYSLDSMDESRPVELNIMGQPADPVGDEDKPFYYWVGVSDYTQFRWDWLGPYTQADSIVLNSEFIRQRVVDATTGEEQSMHFIVLTQTNPDLASDNNPNGYTAVHLKTSILETKPVNSIDYQFTQPYYTQLLSATTGAASDKSSSALDPDTQYVTLTWEHHFDPNRPACEAWLYRIYRKGENEPHMIPIGSLNAPATIYVDPTDNATGVPDAAPGQNYTYYIRSLNTAGYTPFSSLGVVIPSTNFDVAGVAPATAFAGAAVEFLADTTGGPVDTWSWDFGDGALPRYSSDERPVVRITSTTGTYPCSLDISNTTDAAHFDFQLNVTNPIWAQTNVDEPASNIGYGCSLAVDPSNNVHVAYYDIDNDSMVYGFLDPDSGPGFTTTTIDAGNSPSFLGYRTDIAINPVTGHVHLVYVAYENSKDTLKYTRYDGVSWSTPRNLAVRNIWMPSIALDPSGRPHVCYYDPTEQDLLYVYDDGVSWTPVVVDSIDNVGQACSITVDSTYRRHISYADVTFGNLKYAYTDNGLAWHKSTIDDSEPATGYQSSIAIGSDDAIHISYYNYTDHDLMYAYSTDGVMWNIDTVDSTGDVGMYTSISLDLLDRPMISYRRTITEGVQDQLMLAWFHNSAWSSEEASDAMTSKGNYTSLDINSFGEPWIAHFDDTNNDLLVVNWE